MPDCPIFAIGTVVAEHSNVFCTEIVLGLEAVAVLFGSPVSAATSSSNLFNPSPERVFSIDADTDDAVAPSFTGRLSFKAFARRRIV
jgi:hypothetical protein